jgi:hypothetical protein
MSIATIRPPPACISKSSRRRFAMGERRTDRATRTNGNV